jgi:PAS domain S-box-containing protein
MQVETATFSVSTAAETSPAREFVEPLSLSADSLNATAAAEQILQLKAELKRRESQQAAVAEIGQLALSEMELPRLLEQAARLICQTLEAEYCWVLRLSEDGQTLHWQAGVGRVEEIQGATLKVVPEVLAGFALQSAEAVIVNDWQTEQRFIPPPCLRKFKVASSLSVAIPDVEKPYGVLNMHSPRGKQFSAEDGNFLKSIAAMLGAAIARRRTGDSLRQSEARLLEAQRIAQMGHWINDLLASQIYWSAEVFQIFGLPQGQAKLSFEDFLHYVHPADRERLRELQEAVLAGQDSVNVEHRIMRPDGEIRVVFERAEVTRDSRGQAIRLVGTVQDVTEQKQKEQELQEAVYQAELYARQLRGLSEASLLINQAGALDRALEITAEQARQIVGAHQAFASLTTGGNWAQSVRAVSLSDKYARWREYQATQGGNGMYALVCSLNRSLRMTQAELEAHPAWRGFGQHAADHPPLRGWLAAPLVGQDGQNIGLIQLSDKCAGEFSESDETILLQLAQIASVAIENLRLFQNAREADETILMQLMQIASVASENARLAEDAKEAEARLNTQLNFIATISDSLVEGICALDNYGRITFINPAAERMLGWRNANVQGRFIHEFTSAPAEQRSAPCGNVLTAPVIDAQVKEVLSAGKIIRSDEYSLARPDGQCFPISFTLSPFRTEAEQGGVLLAFHDITEAKRAQAQLLDSHEQLRALTARLRTAREEEGARIAREIHDQLGGALTALKWYLEEVARIPVAYPNPAQAPEVTEKLAAMDKLIDSTIKTVRRISSELHPGILDDLGLLPALEWQAQQFQARTGIICQCHFLREELVLSREEARAVFRIFQETLTNVMRHAQASRVEVKVTREAEHLKFEFSDNGRGITEKEKGNRSSLGLLSMQERARLVGGEVCVTGSAGRGTTVTVRLPYIKSERG